MRGRRGYIYRRGHDWIVGYDTGSDEIETEVGHEKLSYVIPGLLQLGGGDHHDGGGEGRGVLPGARSWLYLTRDRDWLYDPSVTVTPRYSRSVNCYEGGNCHQSMIKGASLEVSHVLKRQMSFTLTRISSP